MPAEQVSVDRTVVDEEVETTEEAAPDPADSEWVIRRPKRAIITAEESLRRMEDSVNNPAWGQRTDAQVSEAADSPSPQTSEEDWIIRRPKRAKVTAEEAIKWTEDFASKRKEDFIASIRKSKG